MSAGLKLAGLDLDKLRRDKESLLKRKGANSASTSSLASTANGSGTSSSSSGAGSWASGGQAATSSASTPAGPSSSSTAAAPSSSGFSGSSTSISSAVSSSAYSFVPPQGEKFVLNPATEAAEEEDKLLEEEYDAGAPNHYDEIAKKRKAKVEDERLRKLHMKNQERHQRVQDAHNRPPDDDAATSYMKKLGWREGQGLGKEKQGLAAPLMMQKTDAGAGKIMVGSAMPVRASDPGPGPSRVVLLLNAVKREDADPELKEEMTEEAGRFGAVMDVSVIEGPASAKEWEAVRIFVRYAQISDAQNARAKFHLRSFGGRRVYCYFYDEAKYLAQDYFFWRLDNIP